MASASAMVNAGDGEGALLAANRLLEIDPGFADAHELRAEMLLVLGQPAEVGGAIEAAGAQGIETVGLAVTAGKAALELEDFEGARAAGGSRGTPCAASAASAAARCSARGV